ncbi:MAG TPA: MBL fold metallo-hydrolase [Acidobacteriota bacterium]|nr:MBL fold metallo-hydrolase [Acidobacteriota bacterium]
MFTIEMFPAEHGDCLWIEYGDSSNPRKVLIDAGTEGSVQPLLDRIESLPKNKRHFELLVITHVDADHIGGILELIDKADELDVEFDDIWFNAWKHIRDPQDDILGPVQGEMLSQKLSSGLPWNQKFNGKAIVVPDVGPLPVINITGGLKLTVLSPFREQLDRLRPVWKKVVEEAGLEPGVFKKIPKEEAEEDILGIDVEKLAKEKFKGDKAEANGSSIGLLAEHDGKTIILGADAYAPVLLKSLKLLSGEEKTKVDVFKLPHHGSRANINTELLEKIVCKKFLVSTNGKIFKHPNQQAIARIIKFGGKNPKLYFNYKTKFNQVWDSEGLMSKFGYKTFFPKAGKNGLRLSI